MKVYIAQRMRGLTQAEILADREKAMALTRVYHPDAEFIESFFPDYDTSGDKSSMDYLADTVKLMGQADLIVFAPGFYGCAGAEVEDHIAIAYNIPRLYVNFAVSDDFGYREFINHETEELINGQ